MKKDIDDIVTVTELPKDNYECWKHGVDDPGLFVWDDRTRLPVAFCRQCWLEWMLTQMRPMTEVKEKKYETHELAIVPMESKTKTED